MTGQHFDETALLTYIDGTADATTRDEIEQHISGCDECRENIGSLREFIDQLEDSAVWRSDEPYVMSNAPEEAARRLAAEEERLAREEAEATAFIGRLADATPDRYRAMFEAQLAEPTAGFVRALFKGVLLLLERNPRAALHLAEIAKDAAGRLRTEAYPLSLRQQLLGLAHKHRANALRQLGRGSDALEALDEAERAFSKIATSAYDIACVDFIRATVFRMLDRYDDALIFLESARDTFVEYGDNRRRGHADLVEAGILFARGDIAPARDLFLSLIKEAQQRGDLTTAARLFSNVASCNQILGEKEAAATFYLQAIRLYEELGMPTEKIRARWGLGRLLASSGRIEEAVERLQQAAEEFESHAMHLDAALVFLEICELEITRRNTAAVTALAKALVERFTAARVPSAAITALAYLREASEQGRASSNVVRHVRHYLERLPQEPQLLFRPLA